MYGAQVHRQRKGWGGSLGFVHDCCRQGNVSDIFPPGRLLGPVYLLLVQEPPQHLSSHRRNTGLLLLSIVPSPYCL